MLFDLLQLANATLDRLALSLIIGMGLAALWLAPSVFSAEARRYTISLFAVLSLLLLTICSSLLFRTAVMADVDLSQAFDYIPQVLSRSDYGTFWYWLVSVWCFMLLVWGRIGRKAWSKLTGLILLLAACVVASLISVSGHAGEAGFWSFPNIANTLHIVAGLVWGGAILLYAVLVLPTLRRTGQLSSAFVLAQQLSMAAAIALMIVALSGIYNSWHQFNAVNELWSTRYGWVLLAKLALVLIMVGIGALNFVRWVPRLSQQLGSPAVTKAFKHFLYALRFDSAVYVTVLLVAVYLSSLPPPLHGV